MIGKFIASNLFIFIFTSHVFSQSPVAQFEKRVILAGLQDPWEIVYGPDNYLWITEAKSYTVSRINPKDGKKSEILNLNSDRKFSGKPWPQGGLMGMALHPQLLSGKPFVYLAYVHRLLETKPNFGGNYFQTKLVRYTWNPEKQLLTEPVTICDTIPGSNDHNGGRLLIADEGGKEYLFYTVGDMGAGQFDNGNRPNRAQDINYYQGKVLRFNTEANLDQSDENRWIPAANPFKNAVWTLGHRNPQGLAFALIGGVPRLYASEHGPFSDDELNLLEKGSNYGHPLVIGTNDGNYDGLAAGVSDREGLPGKWNTSYPLINSEAEQAKKIGNRYRDPLRSFYPNSPQFLNKLFTAVLQGAEKPEWSSEAPSSLSIYTSDAIPGWKYSLLMPSLKNGRLIRMKLDQTGSKVEGREEHLFQSNNRYRDLAISPDGTTLYLITDKSAVTSGPTKEDPQGSAEKGAIIEFKWKGR
ncbi:PQQ-dependent sugar dehydrogenase [Pedobacter sp. SYSU D00535]|uniref:PQQ-dependent sugar dehydrogenase n=1 Tax=Pedobacter sp. SYSU D00535 TaxID=2810308 RepID=UPI001A963857|nr:PQQ-dependent sugar dehydrogenase [Pedobacter sp. SYSU D00535]